MISEDLNVQKEEWATLPENMMLSSYMCSNHGQIYSHFSKKVLSLSKNKSGYLVISLVNDHKEKKSYLVSRLIYAAFNPDFDLTKTTDHMNRVRDDNKLTNLRESTMKEQAQNRDPPENRDAGVIIMQMDATTGCVVNYWLSIKEILFTFPGIDNEEIEYTITSGVSIEIEGYLWCRKRTDSFFTLDFDWVNPIMPPNKGNITKVDFQVCREGLIRHNNGTITPGSLDGGYRVITRFKWAIGVHRIICRTFNGPFPEGKNLVDHIDGNTINNRAENLEAVTAKENSQRAWDRKRKQKGLEVVEEIVQLDIHGNKIAQFPNKEDAEAKTGVPKEYIVACIYGWQKTSMGFCWRSANVAKQPDVNSNGARRAVKLPMSTCWKNLW